MKLKTTSRASLDLRALLRKEWAASLVWVLFLTVLLSVGTDSVPIALVQNLIVQGVTVFLLRRLSLLWRWLQFVFVHLPTIFPLTTQMSSWYAGLSLAGILLMVVIVLFAFFASPGPPAGSVLEE